MTGLSLLPIFMIGLLGSVHCVGMCGGIVGAISVAAVPASKFPVAVIVAGAGTTTAASALDGTLRVASYNVGRIGSYAIAGAMAGGIASGARTLAGVSVMQVGGYWLANLMLVALGLYLMGAWRGLAQLEAAGQTIWRRLQPLTGYLLPLDSPLKMLAVGGLWGWLPCGMVYSVLLTAMLTGSALSGATVMLVFGLGTLPTLLAMGVLGAQLRTWMQRRPVRLMSGLIVLSFGLLGLMRATNGLPMHWLDAVCVTSPTAGVQP
ncbi:sulfite exporter TauE/SafE family protein [Undibacterium arcticum]|uniref:Sulfite exporter TauE/SafE family protein n=1 Tax=Undibacterium arcticum TaxID=1762892 RepID=A0ABV7F419_9BURK